LKVHELYHPLDLTDMSIRVVTVHRLLAQPILAVLLQDDSKILEHPPVTEPISNLRILNQPIDHLLKVILCG
jgi:hypothetical protein